MDFDCVHAHLLQEELCRDKKSEDDEGLFISKMENNKRDKNSEEANLTKSGKKYLSKEELSKVTYYYCNKKGYFSNRCFKIISDKNKEGEEAHHTQSSGEYLFSTSIETHRDELWYLDSGATMHMTYKMDAFKTYHKLEKPKIVKMGNHNTQRGIGMGNVHIEMKNENLGSYTKLYMSLVSKIIFYPSIKLVT